jgi:hypothetical protein
MIEGYKGGEEGAEIVHLDKYRVKKTGAGQTESLQPRDPHAKERLQKSKLALIEKISILSTQYEAQLEKIETETSSQKLSPEGIRKLFATANDFAANAQYYLKQSDILPLMDPSWALIEKAMKRAEDDARGITGDFDQSVRLDPQYYSNRARTSIKSVREAIFEAITEATV